MEDYSMSEKAKEFIQKAKYPNHRLHTTDLAATQGAFRQVRPGSDARIPP